MFTGGGDGIKIVTTNGHGISIAADGTSKHGILVTGGTGGTSDGIKAVAGTGGVDIRGNITGNLVGTVSVLTTYTGNTPQTGDSFARLGAPTGASIAADIQEVELDVDVIGTAVTATPGLVWDVVMASHVTAGSTGFYLNASGGAADPWATALPGAYGAGTAGNIVGAIATGVILTSAGLDAVVCETGYNARQALAVCLDMLAAKISGLPAGPAIIRNVTDTANRVSITFDADNNRTSTTVTPPA